MGKVSNCDKCELGFPSIGSLESEARVQRHKKIPHRIPCGKCDSMFISMTHRNFHLYFTHECQCPHCYKFSDGRCSVIYGVAAEKEGRRAMEAMKQERISTINDTEGPVLHFVNVPGHSF